MLVVLDTNVLFRDPLLSSADALAIRDAAEQLGYRLGLAGVVHEEAVHKESQKIEKAASDATKAIRQLEGHGLNLNPSLPTAKEMSGAAADYAAHLRQVFAPKDHLPYPKVTHQLVAKRAMAQRRPFIGKDRGYRDTLLWLTILSDLRDADEKIALICDDNGFSRSRDQDELHPHLLGDLADAALSGDSVVLYKSLGSFVGDHVAPRLESLEGTKEGIKSGTIDALTDLDDKVGIFSDETVTEVYYGGYRDGVSKGIDVIEGVELQEVEEARLLPSQDLFVRTRWGAWVTTTDDSHMPYFEEFEHWKASITVDLVMDQSSYKVKAMEEVAFDLEEPDWERY